MSNMPAERHAQALTSINRPIDPADATYVVYVAHPFFRGVALYLDRDQLDQFNRDPDLFAAEHFGLATADHYREWVRSRGTALCSERTTSGCMCQFRISRLHLNLREWREQHRSRPCPIHARMRAGP